MTAYECAVLLLGEECVADVLAQDTLAEQMLTVCGAVPSMALPDALRIVHVIRMTGTL